MWVLTGDKVSTAVNIGKAAGLLDKNTKCEEMRSVDKKDIKTSFNNIKEHLTTKYEKDDNETKIGLVV